MNSTLDILFMNVPQIITMGYGVKYHRVMLLKVDGQIQNKFVIDKERISIQPISACGTL